MTKRIAIVGRGTVGALSAAHFSTFKNDDWELSWYYDPEIPTQAVGEGSNLNMSNMLLNYFDFSHEDIAKVEGTFKTGIAKEGWGKDGNYFMHTFLPPNVAYHFNAIKLQSFILEKLKERNNISIIESNVTHHSIDADHILDCSGRPKDFTEFEIPKYIPVNAVHVTQCPWDYPRFQHTLAIAKKYGWVFGIPLTNRCSIGYLYNKDLNSLDEIKEDVQEIFERYNLTPGDKTNSFHFGNYHRKINYGERVSYNGNASFFLEPLEATSFSMTKHVNGTFWDLLSGNINLEKANKDYINYIHEIENIIMMHYFSGSKYNTEFWDFARERGINCMRRAIKNNKFKDMSLDAIRIKSNPDFLNNKFNTKSVEYGTWWTPSFYQNINGLQIKDDLLAIMSE